MIGYYKYFLKYRAKSIIFSFLQEIHIFKYLIRCNKPIIKWGSYKMLRKYFLTLGYIIVFSIIHTPEFSVAVKTGAYSYTTSHI